MGRYTINIPSRSLLMSLSFQWVGAEVPSSFLSSSLLFTVSSWRLGKLFCTTTVIPRRFATDNFIPQLRLRWVKSPPVTSAFSGSSTQWRRLHSLLGSSVISRGSGGERFMCFEELPFEVNVFGGMIRESMQIWCGCEWMRRGAPYEPPKSRGRFLFALHTHSLKKKNVIIPGVWLG